eukprot:6195748-Pleurochrysis_carterae.AAC.1
MSSFAFCAFANPDAMFSEIEHNASHNARIDVESQCSCDISITADNTKSKSPPNGISAQRSGSAFSILLGHQGCAGWSEGGGIRN